MSRQADEKNIRSNGSKKTKSKSSGVKFVQFRPSKEERAVIDEIELTAGEAAIELLELCRRGARITFGQRSENESFYVHVRNEEDAFGEGVIISCFHSDPERVLIGMAYAMRTRYSQWPDIQLAMFDDIDW